MSNPQEERSVSLLTSGKPYFESLLAAIDAARKEIHLQVYILSHDNIGRQVIEKLEEAAKRGVRVYILTDAWGSYGFPSKVRDRLVVNGVYFRFFSPFLFSRNWSLGRRMHHKVLVTDRKFALVGGINIADRYYSYGATPWLDFAVFVTGPACEELGDLCMRLWKKKKNISFRRTEEVPVAIRRNDWLRGKSEISSSYSRAIRTSSRSIIIAGAYFLPRKKLLKLLVKAAKRGVKVTLIVSSLSDVPFVKDASYYLYNQLGLEGIDIYEWTPSIMHGKCMMVDDTFITIGSYNVNHLSDFRSLELNIEARDPLLCMDFNRLVKETVLPGCTKYVPSPSGFNFWEKIRISFSRVLLRIIFFLFMHPTRERRSRSGA